MRSNDNLDMVYGLNSVHSLLQGKRTIQKVVMLDNKQDSDIAKMCKQKNIAVRFTDKRELDRMTRMGNHQGFVAFVEPYRCMEIHEFFNECQKSDPLLIILDGIEDPNNFGSIIRTSAAFGIDGIIIAKDRQIQMTPTVSKVSTGAEEFVPIIQVTNLVQTIKLLKKQGFWIVASDGRGDRLYDEIDYSGKMAIVVGSEGRGASRLTLENSDFIARIPISGPITSLNAAVAGAVFISAAVRSRSKK